VAPPSAGRPRLRRKALSERKARVLLLHGLGCKTDMWDPFVARCTGEFELWDVELPWHGIESADWSWRGDPVDLLVDSVRTGDAPAFDAIVAHSYTASLLVEAMSDRRLEPVACVLVNPFHRFSPEDFDWATISYYLNDFHRIFAEALDVGNTQRVPEAWRTATAVYVRDQIGAYGWMRFFEAYLRSPFVPLSTIDLPLLVLTGQEDIATRSSDGRHLAAALPRGEFAEIEGCGHFPMAQQPDRFARIVDGFLCDALSIPTVPENHVWS
jgi:pimeloyl-ACP methyl ester carboxylesterase